MSENQKTNTPAEKKHQDKAAKVKKPSFFSRVGKWGRELKSETKKIVWPGKKQVTNNTAVVLVTILIVGVFIWVLDAIFNFGVSSLLGYFA